MQRPELDTVKHVSQQVRASGIVSQKRYVSYDAQYDSLKIQDEIEIACLKGLYDCINDAIIVSEELA